MTEPTTDPMASPELGVHGCPGKQTGDRDVPFANCCTDAPCLFYGAGGVQILPLALWNGLEWTCIHWRDV